jgi:hypothetical protein
MDLSILQKSWKPKWKIGRHRLGELENSVQQWEALGGRATTPAP